MSGPLHGARRPSSSLGPAPDARFGSGSGSGFGALLATSLAALLLAASLPTGAVRAATLDEARERGVVRCGVNTGLAGFATVDSLGGWSGFDIDLCRAVAAAALGDADAFRAIPVTTVDRFDALAAGIFDVLTRNTTWTLERNARNGQFAGVNFYDGQGFMASLRSGIRSAFELDDRSVCVGRDTTSELNAADFFAVSELRFRPVYFDDDTLAFEAYARGECDAVTGDRSALAAQRASLDEPEAHAVLPEIISKEPLGPVVRADDPAWENIVRWSLNCMIDAEEMGIDNDTVARPATAATPAARRLLGLEGEAGAALGIAPDWCARIVREVGNYAEVYDRHLGPDTAIDLPRGVNALWSDGGLLYAPPIR